MKIILVTVGGAKKDFVNQGITYYLTMLKKYGDVRQVVLKPSKSGEIARIKQEETEAVTQFCSKQRGVVIICNPSGKEYTSESFATLLKNSVAIGVLIFVIGGSNGLDYERLRQLEQVALSSLTLEHELAKLILVEQVFRGFSIIHGAPYHK